MNTNINSPSELTEFAPLSPDGSQPVVTSIFSKIFNLTKTSTTNNQESTFPNNNEQNLLGDSESWRKSKNERKLLDVKSEKRFSLDDTNEGRSLPNVLKRISNIVALKNNNLQSYKDSQLRSYWMPDSVSKQCYECGERFTTFKRRHHCRVCGQIFCSKCCCDEIPGKIMGCTGDLRVCTYCCKVVLSYLQSSDMRSDLSSDLKALQEDLEEKYGNNSSPMKYNNGITENEILIQRKPSVGYMEEKYAFKRTLQIKDAIYRLSHNYLTYQERTFDLQNSTSLRVIYEELFRSNKSIILQTHRIRLNRYYNCFLGNELVNWMTSHNKATTRIQATAIGQALFEAGFIEPVLLDNAFCDSTTLFKPAKLSQVQRKDFLMESQTSCDAQEPAWVKTIPQHDSIPDSENDNKLPIQVSSCIPSSDSNFYLDLNIEASIVTLKRPMLDNILSISTNCNNQLYDQKDMNSAKESNSRVSEDVLHDTLVLQEIKNREEWHQSINLENTYSESCIYNSIVSAYKQHEDSLLQQLLNKEGLSQNWSAVIFQIVHQIVGHVRPDFHHNIDDMDIKQYVQIKKTPGGYKNECEIISGVVCSKNIAHKGMNTIIMNAKILLLRCGLMYQRVEGKLLSLEPVMLQEYEYLGHTVARITALGPDIVLVHRSVSRLAQDRLRECGVTLILNVKLSILERLSRCTGANIVDTIDAHISARYKLGTCKKFYLKNFANAKSGVKTLMYFEGCAKPHLGATVLLRGGSQNELKKVKNVTSTMIFAAYSSRLEKSFLVDEFARPPSPKDNSFLDESSRNASSDKIHEFTSNQNIEYISSNNDSIYELSFKKNSSDTGNDYLDIPKIGCKDKSVMEEKRMYGESVRDKSDPLHQYMNAEEDEVIQQISPTNQYFSVTDLPLLNKFKKALDDTILSISPYMKFSIPYLETELGRNCALRNFFPKELYYSAYFSDKFEGTKVNTSGEMTNYEYTLKKIKFKSKHLFLQAKLTMSAESREMQILLSDFRACGSRLPPTNNESQEKKQIFHQNESTEQMILPDCLDPASHQGLSVLFCSFLRNSDTNNAPAFCVNPWVVNMDLYGRNDITLGRFLERYCLTTDYKCPAQNCRAQIAQHVRRFVHDGGCVHINLCEMSTDPFDNPGEENQIFMWSKCNKCKSVSPVVPISDDTWSLSFAKYLELRFHGNVYTRYDTNNSCSHSLHHDHQQYFSKCKMLAVIRYSKISQWEISLPPAIITVTYDSLSHINAIEEMKMLVLKGDEVFCSIKENIFSLQDESIFNIMKGQLIKDQQSFKNKIEELQLKLTSPLLSKNFQGKQSDEQMRNLIYKIDDDLVILKRLISDTVFNWNAKFVETTIKKKDERHSKKTTDRNLTVNVMGSGSIAHDNDIYITEEITGESQFEDYNHISTDNAIDAFQTNVQVDDQVIIENINSDTADISINLNPEEIIVTQGSPRTLQPSFCDAISQNFEEIILDKKKKKKTILFQLLPSISSTNIISNPLGSLEHHLLPLGSLVPIVVYESEPSSIIAYALDSHDYKLALQERMRGLKGSEWIFSPLNKKKLQDIKENVLETSQSVEFKKPSVLSFLRGNNLNANILVSPIETDKIVYTTETTSSIINSNIENDDDKKTTKQQQQNYIEVQFADSTTNFYCRIYFAAQFATFRENVLPYGEEGYTRSLSRSIQWAARGGKSGSTFCKTKDDRFILKEMTRMDMQIFLDFAPNYFAYVIKCQKMKQPTLLGKIVGIYRVSFKNNTTNAALRTSVLVMENLFYRRSITHKFDLKGSVRNRLVNLEEVDHEGELVLLDENLLNMSCDSPLYIRPHAKTVLNKAIEEDTKFLADNSVMDYSLLVGLEPDSDELVLGIIDYLRTFTWDKKIETMVKKSGILGGQGKLPTIVSPVEYRARFIAAMHKYFLPVPDRWTGLSRSIATT